MKIEAILSTTILPLDGIYAVRTLAETPNVEWLQHYVGHPTTAAILEERGALPATFRLFPGLQPGQSCLACSIKQGESDRASKGFTTPHQDVTIEDLEFRVVTRIGQFRLVPAGDSAVTHGELSIDSDGDMVMIFREPKPESPKREVSE